MKIILMGEPMGLFMANESGSLCEANTFTASYQSLTKRPSSDDGSTVIILHGTRKDFCR